MIKGYTLCGLMVAVGLILAMPSIPQIRDAGGAVDYPHPTPLPGKEPTPSPQRGEGWGEERADYLPPDLRPPFWSAKLPDLPPLQPEAEPTPPPIPHLPDIQVAWLSRDPLYASYQVEYPDGHTPMLRPGTENNKRWPDPGETVTFTAHVANRGLLPTGSFTYRWLLDGDTVLSGTVPGLAPGQWISLTLGWAWEQVRHWVAFEADNNNAVIEISEQNNSLLEATEALYHEVRVHPYIYEAFSRYPNMRGSYAFEDWLQAQYAMMNRRFAQAVYPEAPQGILERVRVNAIRVTTDLYNAPPNYDGGWQFDVPPDDPDTPENESRQWADLYAATFARRTEWGLIHELTHQIGFIDLYQVAVEASRVTLPDKDGLPLLAAHACRYCDLMGGGDTSPYRDGTYYSSYAAAAINRNYGYRRGYYGDFLFDIPVSNVLALQDNSGLPLAGAQVEIYQSEDSGLLSSPVISGTSSADGIFVLPNRPVSVEITTATGHTLHPNPFGQIDVVGRNGLFLIKATRNGHEDYLWKQILDFNLAYWAGMTQTYIFTWTTHLPSAEAPSPVPTLTGRFERGTVSLSWPAAPQAAFYRVYKTEEPYYTWESLGLTAATSFVTRATRNTRYAVTAIDVHGRESGFSPIHRAFYWVYPNDVAYHADSGNWYVLDGHSGALVELLRDGRVVGSRLSPHQAMVGARAMSGRLNEAIAIVQESAVTVLNSHLRRLGYVGKAEREPPRLEQATGILLTGQAFTITQRPVDDADTLFLARFDGDLMASGSPPLTATVTLTSGLFGQAVEIGAESRLVYTGTGHFVQGEGGLDFWVRPQWAGETRDPHVLFSIGDGSSYLFEVGAVGGYLYAYVTNFGGYHQAGVWGEIKNWQAREWHHVGIAWLPHWLKLYIDGEMTDAVALRRAITGTLGTLNLGTNGDGDLPALAALDEVRISRHARVGNSDQVRLLVSEETNGRIKVLDLMGNVLTTWSDPQVIAPRGLAMRPDGLVAVADTGNGTIKLLSLDGNATLRYQATLVAGLSRPHNLSGTGRWLIVPDYGNGRVNVYTVTGDLVTTFEGPNDGYAGPFAGPVAVARGLFGDLLVSDMAKQRVVFVRRGLPDAQVFLPIMMK